MEYYVCCEYCNTFVWYTQFGKVCKCWKSNAEILEKQKKTDGVIKIYLKHENVFDENRNLVKWIFYTLKK